ncbi:uncharacterized protein LOC109720072 [Ananas comosus]|uniref:Uncharacterized protein LOC109720072 n=1 Tax=Ananas comosus TaxID=4615 RepID=A0A6P5G2E4_ANACO|nr:uncharacterized protein LOC109720072 [Ananas comosus]XP_020102539.1 uncharacterized protein LOC109720072 [Ananas comosus]
MTSTTKLSVKLLVDTKANKVLFAEAGKDVVDFLFSLLVLPVGTIIKLITKESMVGSVANIRQSLESLDSTYLLSGRAKVDLLNPKVSVPSLSENGTLLLPTCASSSSMGMNKRYYRCSCNYNSSCHNYVTDVSGTRCPGCNNNMTKQLQYVEPNSSGTVQAVDTANGLGVVKGVLTYTIMDDLTIRPMSTISSITLLNTCHVKDLSVLQEMTVKLGIEEGLRLLKASLQSKTVLTDVFLAKRGCTSERVDLEWPDY